MGEQDTYKRLLHHTRQNDLSAALGLLKHARRRHDLDGLLKAVSALERASDNRTSAAPYFPSAELHALAEDLKGVVARHGGGRFVLTRAFADALHWGRDLQVLSTYGLPARALVLRSQHTTTQQQKERFLEVFEPLRKSSILAPTLLALEPHNEDNVLFAALRVPEGEPLETRVPLAPRRALRLVREVAWAVQRFHNEGCVLARLGFHPKAIFTRTDDGGHVTLAGILTLWSYGSALLTKREPNMGLPKPRAWFSRLLFFPPEVIETGLAHVNAASDVFLLGQLLRYTIAGQPLFTEPDRAALSRRLSGHLTESWPSWNAPAEIKRVVSACMRLDPEDRLSLDGLISRLDALLPLAEQDENYAEICVQRTPPSRHSQMIREALPTLPRGFWRRWFG